MKTLTRSLILALTVGLMVFGCRPEQNVAPKNDSPAPSLGAYGDDIHPRPDPNCSGDKRFVLTTVAGDTADNRGTKYGDLILANSPSYLWFQANFAREWFVDIARIYVGPSANFPLDNNGQFDPESFPFQVNLPVIENQFQWSIPLDSVGENCNNIVVYLSAVQSSFFGGVNEATRTGLYGRGTLTARGWEIDFCPTICGRGPDPRDCELKYNTGTQCLYGDCGGASFYSNYRDANFATTFPNGLTLGCTSPGGYTLSLTSAAAVNNFLPSAGGNKALKKNFTDPLGGVAAGKAANWNFCADVVIPTCPMIIDFEKDANGNALQAGTVVTEQFAGMGIHVSAQNNRAGHPDKALIFDSANPTGGDFDLGTPNQAFGGPGRGSGGASPAAPNNVAMNNVLIIAENDTDNDSDGFVDNPDDEAGGGELRIDFDNPVDISELVLVDTDDGRQQSIIACEGPGGTQTTLTIPDNGDNSVSVIAVNATNVTSLKVNYRGSGSIGEVRYCPTFDDPNNNTCFNTAGNGYKNTLAGRLAALVMNVEFDKADPNFSPADFPLWAMEIKNGPFAGWKVDELISEANKVLGGCSTAFSAGDLSGAIAKINKAYINGTRKGKFIICPAAN